MEGDKPLFSIELNEFEKPTGDYKVDLRRFAISLGLLRPGDKRTAIVEILDILLQERKNKPEGLNSVEITSKIYERGISIVYANILRDLRKLINLGIVENINKRYRIKENLSLQEILDKYVKPYVIDRIYSKIKEYATAAELENPKK